MTREEIEQLADKRYPTAKDGDASLTTIAEREGWIAGFEAGRQSVIDNIPDLEWYEPIGHLYDRDWLTDGVWVVQSNGLLFNATIYAKEFGIGNLPKHEKSDRWWEGKWSF